MKHALSSLSTLVFITGSIFFSCSTDSNQNDTNKSLFIQFSPSQSQPKAIRLAQDVINAIGGQEGIDSVKYLSFRFTIESESGLFADWQHYWDREANRYRLDGLTRQNEHIVVYFNINTQKGLAFRNGTLVPEDEIGRWLGMAYSRFINDNFWLLAPFKLMDPGAKLEYYGEQKIADTDSTLEVLKLSYIKQVGLTPENIYKFFIDKDSKRIIKWEYLKTEESNPIGAYWEEWQAFSNIRLATVRKIENSQRRIIFKEIVASSEIDDSVFILPAKAKLENSQHTPADLVN